MQPLKNIVYVNSQATNIGDDMSIEASSKKRKLSNVDEHTVLNKKSKPNNHISSEDTDD